MMDMPHMAYGKDHNLFDLFVIVPQQGLPVERINN